MGCRSCLLLYRVRSLEQTMLLLLLLLLLLAAAAAAAVVAASGTCSAQLQLELVLVAPVLVPRYQF
jgi:hypothetical protein